LAAVDDLDEEAIGSQRGLISLQPTKSRCSDRYLDRYFSAAEDEATLSLLRVP
jgi:hypothetical protein